MVNALLHRIRRLRYPGSQVYWEQRYGKGGNSGTGSSGKLAQYKAEIINRFIRENNIQSVLELGCGDGQQLQLADYPFYTGLDIAPAALARCRTMFAGDTSKRFERYDPFHFQPNDFQSDIALSLEVVFHLTEDDLYECYLRHLFAAARRWVLVFSSDEADTTGGRFPHVRPRHFTADVPRLAPGWILRERIANPHRTISMSDFFIFEKSISEPG